MTELKTSESRRAHPDAAIPPPVLDPSYRFYPPDESIDLVEVWRAMWRDRYLMAVIVFIAATIGVVSGLIAKPIYRAEVVMVSAGQARGEGGGSLIGQLGGIGALLEGYVGGGKDQTAEALATLSSRSLTTDFIKRYDLKRQLFSDRWDTERQQWHVLTEVPTDQEAYALFDKSVRSVRQDRRNGLVSLAIEWRDPVAAAQWANALVAQVNERRRIDAISEARKSIDHLRNQVAKTQSVEIQQAIFRLIEAQSKTIAVASAREDFAFKVIDPAVAPEKRIHPNRTMMALIGLASGFIIAVGVVLIRHVLRRRRFPALRSS
jgi:uncharacterized protein involved in exopolysaccharide biosynthesis